jgi:hypothetical protein
MMKKNRRTPQQWQKLITDWQHSGQSVTEFCKEQHLILSNFYLWRKQLVTVVPEISLPYWVASLDCLIVIASNGYCERQ